jgi:hypothetical protein
VSFQLNLTPSSCNSISIALSILVIFSFLFTSDKEVNEVADKLPVEGLKFSFVEETYVAVGVPLVTSTYVTYLVEVEDVSSVTELVPLVP